MNVFVIINEWTDIAGNTSSEIVGATFFTTQDSAWDSLALVAEALGEELPPHETSFSSESDPHLEYQEYYIQELTRA